jgi:ornithine cyclodeaminase/alanine dehydrogenase-like protein (mu-crystallin family)
MVISEADIRSLTSRELAIESQRVAYRATTGGLSATSGVMATEDDGALVFAVAGRILGLTGVTFKIGRQLPSNRDRGLASLQSMVIMMEADTGQVLACLNGGVLSALRTTAGVAVAADVLAVPGARTLGVFGSGAQARDVVGMISAVRPITDVRIWSPSQSNRESLVEDLRAEALSPVTVTAVSEPRLACEGCDIVVTCTTSKTPVFRGEWLTTGATILTIGSYAPDLNEIDLLVSSRASRTFVDDIDKASKWCGPVISAISGGLLKLEEIAAIGDFIGSGHLARQSHEEILVFHSVGVAAQDAALSWMIYERALSQGLGARVEF